MPIVVLVWEIGLLFLLVILLVALQDWNQFWLFKKYVENQERKRDELEAEKLLDDLPKGVIRYKEREITQNK